MAEWARIKWTEAGQIFSALDLPCAEESASVTPKAQFDALIEAGEFDTATHFLALALPRYESVVWAARAVGNGSKKPREIDKWIADPTDLNRRAVWAAGEGEAADSPDRLVAAATFLSGGSIAPEDLPAIQPDPNVCARLSAAAVLVHAYRAPDPKAFLKDVLAAGAVLAEKGAVPS
jgi:hypothetical protein